MSNNQVANLYQEFERGYFAMYISGPWNIGEFRSRLSPALQNSWSTAPLPGPTGAASGVSLAGGSSLVLFKDSRHKEAAWKLIEYLARPEVQVRFWRLTGDLPARRESWADPGLARDARTMAFGEQLERAGATPKVPEWEEISQRLQSVAETVIRGAATPDSALRGLDHEVDNMLEKRRWLLERQHGGAGRTGGGS